MNNTDKQEIRNHIANANLKGLIKKLSKFKLFSKEKGQIKVAKNNIEFMVNNNIKYKGDESTFNNIEKSLNSILTKIK